MLSSPQTKLMCGVGLMKSLGWFSRPSFTWCDQNWRETSNDSAMPTARLVSMLPSGSSGV